MQQCVGCVGVAHETGQAITHAGQAARCPPHRDSNWTESIEPSLRAVLYARNGTSARGYGSFELSSSRPSTKENGCNSRKELQNLPSIEKDARRKTITPTDRADADLRSEASVKIPLKNMSLWSKDCELRLLNSHEVRAALTLLASE